MKALQTLCWRKWWILAISVIVAAGGYIIPVAAEPSDPAFAAGLEAVAERDIPAAVVNLEEALRRSAAPAERAELNLLLGLVYRWNDQPDEAIAALESVLAFDPDLTVSFPEQKVHNLNPTGMLGYCYKDKGDWATALRWFEKRLEQCPDSDRMIVNIATARRKVGQTGTLTAGPMVVAKNRYVPGPVKHSSGRLLVTARELAQRLGAAVSLKSSGQAAISSSGHRLQLRAGSRQAVLNGKRVTLPVAPIRVKDKLLVPLRFVAEALGHKVIWEALPRIAWIK